VPNDKTLTEMLREKVTADKDVQNLIKLFTQFAMIEGDWTIETTEKGNPLLSVGRREWAATKAHVTVDIEDHGYDITKWEPESIAALMLCLLGMPTILKNMRTILIAVVDAHSRDEQTEAIGRLIRAIVEEGEKREKTEDRD